MHLQGPQELLIEQTKRAWPDNTIGPIPTVYHWLKRIISGSFKSVAFYSSKYLANPYIIIESDCQCIVKLCSMAQGKFQIEVK